MERIPDPEKCETGEKMTIQQLIDTLNNFDKDSNVYIKIMQNRMNNCVISRIDGIESSDGRTVILPSDLSELTEEELRYVYAMLDD